MNWEGKYRSAVDQLRLPEQRRKAILEIPRGAGRTSHRWRRGGLRTAAVLTAAAVLLAVGGTALVWQPGVLTWFGRSWGAITGRPVDEAHHQLLQALSQTIGVSDTANGVTVTADSAVVGDDSFWVLLTVSGPELSSRHGYTFREDDLTLEPDPGQPDGIFGWGLESHGVNEQGEAELLLQYSYQSSAGINVPWSEDLAVELRLTDLIQSEGIGSERVVAQGEWELSFVLEAQNIETLRIPDTWVAGEAAQDGTQGQVLLQDITLTATGIRFLTRGEERPQNLEPMLVLRDGTEVKSGDGSGTILDGEQGMAHSFHWAVPVDLSQVCAVYLGSAEVLVEETDA